jgi:hypothetical protein
MKTKFVYESISDLLKPKSKEEITKDLINKYGEMNSDTLHILKQMIYSKWPKYEYIKITKLNKIECDIINVFRNLHAKLFLNINKGFVNIDKIILTDMLDRRTFILKNIITTNLEKTMKKIFLQFSDIKKRSMFK